MADDERQPASANGEDDLEELLEYVRDARGFDFTGYKRASLTRRIHKRMQTVGIESMRDYRALLEAQPEEFVELFNTVLINVTEFFRDPDAWQYLREAVVPRIIDTADDDSAIRVWSAGCASGQETYSLAVVLCDALGEEAFRHRVKIYGTDADEDALAEARHARYPLKQLTAAFTLEQLDRYFEPNDSGMAFRKDLRRSVIFGRHDLVRDPPISRVDLLVCRNTLMYLTADVQRSVLANFLFLGKSEALASRTNLFTVDDLKRHVFVKRADSRAGRPPLPAPIRTAPRPPDPPPLLIESAFETSPLARVIVLRDGRLLHANRHARGLFGIGIAQIGRPFRDLELSYRPAELRSRIDDSLEERRSITVSEVEIQLPGGITDHLDIHIVPLEGDSDVAGVCVSFVQVGRYKQLRDELERSRRELETAYEELQSTVEELETTNEELQSTNEELETTNEELHSTNEELETMNEELQSTNEELETINNELRDRTAELDSVTAFQQSILGSLSSGVVVLDRDMAVRIWNDQAADLWGLRADEVDGHHFLNLDIGLPVDRLRAPIRACLSGQSSGEQLTLAAVNRRGRQITCLVTISPLKADTHERDGVILVMDEDSAPTAK